MISNNSQTSYQIASQVIPNDFANQDREVLITAHLPKVKYIADRMSAKLPPSVEREDLYGAGVLGLIDAVERFDVSRGVAFTTFAEMRVRGAILDSLRALDWAPRSVRRRAKELQTAFAKCEQENGRAATEEEVAAHLNISLPQLRQSLNEMRCLTVSEIERRDKQTGLSVIDTLFDDSASPLEEYEQAERRARLATAVNKLPFQERQIVSLYYLEELTMKEIGTVLTLSESRVSQLKTQAVIRMRRSLSVSN
jgi:RNA polymerase sigma factor for flagellar operon FliA